jgi:hypothetical protein
MRIRLLRKLIKQKLKAMEGIHYVTDENNRRIAVQIDLEKYGELWEDFIDYIVAVQRKDDESKPLEEVVKSLKASGNLNENL